MNNKILIPTILFVVVLIFSFFALAQEKNKNNQKTESIAISQSTDQQSSNDSQIILFYGDGCPHCAIVEKYLKENNIQDKIAFSQKEVYYNQANAKELTDKAKACGLSTDSIGVPFLWDGKNCFIGDRDIINFFAQQIISLNKNN